MNNSKSWFASFLAWLARKYCYAVSPRRALRFLFMLDARLYSLQSRFAVAFDNGTHPKHRITKYHDFFTDRISSTESVLDVGCGKGSLTFDIASRSEAQVTGIDMDPGHIRRAGERCAAGNITYIEGDVMTDLTPAHYDVVVLSNVLEHVPDRGPLLRLLIEKCTPGRFLLRVPLFERDWRVGLKKELDCEWRLDPSHVTEYTQESFQEELAAAGLKITHSETRWGEIWAEACPGKP